MLRKTRHVAFRSYAAGEGCPTLRAGSGGAAGQRAARVHRGAAGRSGAVISLAATVARIAAYRLFQSRVEGTELSVELLETILRETLEQVEAERTFRARRGLSEPPTGGDLVDDAAWATRNMEPPPGAGQTTPPRQEV